MSSCLRLRGAHIEAALPPSPCSPILSFYCCKPMWEKIAAAAREAGCLLTVYVDDITISGRAIPETLVWRIKQILHSYGHGYARKKERQHRNRAAEVTGIMVDNKKVSVPHRHFKKMQQARLGARLASDEREKTTLHARARSLEGQIQNLRSLTD